MSFIIFDNTEPIYLSQADLKYFNGQSLLEYCSRHYHCDIETYILKFCTDISMKDYAPILWSATNGKLDAVKFLVKEGSRKLYEALHLAIIHNHFDIVKYLISKNIKFVDNNYFLSSNYNKLRTHCNREIIKYVIQHFNHIYDLILEATDEDIEYYLSLDIKCDINRNNSEILLSAIKYGYINKVMILIKKGAKIHKKALGCAVRYNRFNIVIYLITICQVDIHMMDDSALAVALGNRNEEMIKYLLLAGANLKRFAKKHKNKYKYYSDAKYFVFLCDFHYKRETEFSQNELSDINVLKYVYAFV